MRLNDLLLPIVKGYGSEKAYELLATSLQVFGGSGFTQDYPVEQYIRDAKIDTLYEGTTADPGPGPVLPQDRPRPGPGARPRSPREIQEFAKGDAGNGTLARERELLGHGARGRAGHRRPLVNDLMASARGPAQRLQGGPEHHARC